MQRPNLVHLVFLSMGELKIAEDHINWFISYARTRSLGPYLAVGNGFKGQLAILQDDARRGVEMLLGCLKRLHEVRYELLTLEFNISLVEGLIAVDRYEDGLILANETIDFIECFYNPKRRHSTLGYLSPVEFARKAGLA